PQISQIETSKVKAWKQASASSRRSRPQLREPARDASSDDVGTSTPFGLPVDPDVKRTYAISAAPARPAAPPARAASIESRSRPVSPRDARHARSNRATSAPKVSRV